MSGQHLSLKHLFIFIIFYLSFLVYDLSTLFLFFYIPSIILNKIKYHFYSFTLLDINTDLNVQLGCSNFCEQIYVCSSTAYRYQSTVLIYLSCILFLIYFFYTYAIYLIS